MGVFATRYFKSPCDGIGGTVKQHVAKRSLQRFLNNQILDYKAMLDLCENEMKSIKFFEICKRSMISVENLEIENDMKVGKLYLSHGVVTIFFYCHPHELVIS